jgi:23S rRNA (pseudouridine1915-N3)-methyltransferase
MKLLLAAVGKSRPGPEQTLFEHYRQRLGWSLTVKEVEEKRPLSAVERIEREAALLEAALPQGVLRIVLDERGKIIGSVEFADIIRTWRDRGQSSLAFIIGGADGHAAAMRESATLLLSLGAMTWPHMLVRGLLAEQLFRAESILNNHPYHRV